MSETTCTHKWDWRKYGPCIMCGPAPIIDTDCTATRKPPVDVAEIIEQVRAIKTPKPFCIDQYIKNEVVDRVIGILERHR